MIPGHVLVMNFRMGILLFVLLAECLLSPTLSGAEIIVHDGIGKKGQETMLVAETRGLITAKGGEVVDFYAEGKVLGRALSGGDGYAFRAFVPSKTGLIPLTVKGKAEKADGALLVVGGKREIVGIEIDQNFLLSLRGKEKNAVKHAAEKIVNTYDVIYISRGFPGMSLTKHELGKQGFPPYPVIAWGNGNLFTELLELGGKVEAVIGSPEIIEEGKRDFPGALGFEDLFEATAGDSWEDGKGFIRAQ